ncbi:MAG: type II secretion system F family protein [Actinomycetota bacterium]
MSGFRRRRHAALVASQLADAVRSVAGGLRSGASLSGSLASAAKESPPPVADVLSDIVSGEAAGAGIDDGLARWAVDAEDDDVGLVVAALRMHRRAGGDLPTVLDRLAATLDERTASRREVRSLTAQARLSGLVVGLLPVGFFAFLSLTSPRDMAVAYASPIGAFAMVTGLVLEGGAFMWIRHLLRVDP